MWKYIFYILIITVLFIIYVEHTVGNILFRINSQGYQSINFSSMIHFLLHPLHNSFLWNYKLLDINYPFILCILSFIYLKI